MLNGEKRYVSGSGDSIRGEYYKPDGCTCGKPPWELCKKKCPHRLQ